MRHATRSIAEITTAGLSGTDAESLPYADALAFSRRIGRLLAPHVRTVLPHFDLTNPANLRISDTEVTIFTKSAAFAARMKLIQPRLEKALADAGYVRRIVFKLNTLPTELPPLGFVQQKGPRIVSEKTLDMISEESSKLPDSATKKALQTLSEALRQK